MLCSTLPTRAGTADPPLTRTPHSTHPPNIVFIITDDQEIETLRYMPRLQALVAGQGVTFTNMFVTEPQCCPSHVSILTGQYPHNTGVLNNFYPTGGWQKFFESGGESSTLATWLQDAGYATGRFRQVPGGVSG
jgi:N-acetylglucosamine-6-sulfatase